MESASDLWSQRKMAPKSCLWRMTLPTAWFTARNACCLYHCCPDRSYTQPHGVQLENWGDVKHATLCSLTFVLDVLWAFISSKNCIFNTTRGSILGGNGRPVMMTARPKVSAKSRPSLAWQEGREAQQQSTGQHTAGKKISFGESTKKSISMGWRQNFNLFLNLPTKQDDTLVHCDL